MPYSTKKPSAGKSGKYGPLWSKLTRVMLAPAMRSITGKEVASKHKKGGGHMRSRGKTFGNEEFIRAWTRPLRAVGRAPKSAKSVKKVARSRARVRRRRSHHRGGFIRDGSVQHFPSLGAEEDVGF